MHIEPTHGFDTPGLPEKARNVPQPESSAPAGPTPPRRTPPAGSSTLAPYIREAAAAQPVRTAAVADAKRLLASGGLDTEEAARGAAEAILTFGL